MTRVGLSGAIIGFLSTFVLGWLLLSAQVEHRFLLLDSSLAWSVLLIAIVGASLGALFDYLGTRELRLPVKLASIAALVFFVYNYVLSFVRGDMSEGLVLLSQYPGIMAKGILMSSSSAPLASLTFTVLVAWTFWGAVWFGIGYFVEMSS